MGKKVESKAMEGLGGGNSSNEVREFAEVMDADELIVDGKTVSWSLRILS